MDRNNESENTMRLQVFLAQAGLGSRRACETIIDDLRVSVNGEMISRHGVQVSDDDVIKVDGKQVYRTKKSIYLALHKPPGYLCAQSDPEGRPLAVELLQSRYGMRLYTVGRLDFNSSGLIFVTNDGDFAQAVSHPSNAVEKEYIVQTRKPVTDEFLESCVRGLNIEGVQYRFTTWERAGSRSVRVTLLEGKNREIRTVFNHYRFGVKRVHRVRIGPVKLFRMAPGRFRPLTKQEIQWFMKNSGAVSESDAPSVSPPAEAKTKRRQVRVRRGKKE
ncbi:MAG: rRNA pseudouridine synthase [Spirochaetaceae bacterium]|nr:MAG: rRNA pseudouridine synthase [Spirochaetaceae bacterium]